MRVRPLLHLWKISLQRRHDLRRHLDGRKGFHGHGGRQAIPVTHRVWQTPLIFAHQIKIATTPAIKVGAKAVTTEKMHILHQKQLQGINNN